MGLREKAKKLAQSAGIEAEEGGDAAVVSDHAAPLQPVASEELEMKNKELEEAQSRISSLEGELKEKVKL